MYSKCRSHRDPHRGRASVSTFGVLPSRRSNTRVSLPSLNFSHIYFPRTTFGLATCSTSPKECKCKMQATPLPAALHELAPPYSVPRPPCLPAIPILQRLLVRFPHVFLQRLMHLPTIIMCRLLQAKGVPCLFTIMLGFAGFLFAGAPRSSSSLQMRYCHAVVPVSSHPPTHCYASSISHVDVCRSFGFSIARSFA